jgi:hypothetical protein
MNKEHLAQYLSNKLWISKDKLMEVMCGYVEETPQEHIYIKGEQVEFSDDGATWFSGKFIRNQYDDNKRYPYLIEKPDGYNWSSKHIRPLQIQPTKKNLNIEPIIHAEKPNNLEGRIKRIEQHLKL